jgi:hypothetical protein
VSLLRILSRKGPSGDRVLESHGEYPIDVEGPVPLGVDWTYVRVIVILVLTVGVLAYLAINPWIQQAGKIRSLSEQSRAISDETYFGRLQGIIADEWHVHKCAIAKDSAGMYEIEIHGGGLRGFWDIWTTDLGSSARSQLETLLPKVVSLCGDRLGRISRITVIFRQDDDFGNAADYVVELKPDAELLGALHDRSALMRLVSARVRIVKDSATGRMLRTVPKP